MDWSYSSVLNIEFNPLYHPINSNIYGLGNEVDCSADGNILVCGANLSVINGIIRGAVCVFVNNGSWHGNIIYQDFYNNFGCSVSINFDGTKILIGRYSDNDNTGNAFIYNISTNGWLNGKNTYSSLSGSNINISSYFGKKVKFGNNICCIGGNEKIWLFKFNGINWYEFQTITNPGQYYGFGMYSIDFSNNNEYLIVGAPDNIGGVYIFKLIKQQYILIQIISSNKYEGNNPRQGYSIGISGDGSTIVYGGISNGISNDKGGIWIWRKYGNRCYEEFSQLTFSGNFSIVSGYSISLSKDGSILAVGGRNSSNISKGAIGIYY
jgi:hypothetical protein